MKKIHHNFITKLSYSAKDLGLTKVKMIFITIILLCLLIVDINQNIVLNLILIAGNIAIFLNQIFKIFLTIGYNQKLNNHAVSDYKLITKEELPLYTILVPLYKESRIAKQLIENLTNLNYPKEKLQILLLCEEDDKETLQAFQKFTIPKFFEILIIPHSLPKTKPKACNYGLQHAQGKYITIYDADDKPDINQLYDVVRKFTELPQDYICIQAKLNYYNRTENLLTKLFAIEYYHWFEMMLPSLYKYGMIIPLGGSSNHFITAKLCEIGGWDAYNVTEDAELGLRIGVMNYKTYLLDSVTLEESPLTIKSWIVQRSRWIKGYMKTYILYLKDIKRKSTFSMKENIGFHFFVGLPMFTFVILPFIPFIIFFDLGISSSSFVNLKIYNLNATLGWINLVLMILLPIVIAILVFRKSKWQLEIFTIMSYPFYWWLHTISSYRAVYHLFKMTYYWDKTEHGLAQIKNNLYKEK